MKYFAYLALLVATPLAAQVAQVQAPLGLDKTGSCRRITVYDPTKAGSDKTVSVACLNSSNVVEIRDIKDLRGDDAPWATVVSARGSDIRSGTTAAPTNGAGAIMKISKTEKVVNLSEMGGNNVDNRYNAALYVAVNSIAGSLGQPNAILGVAQGSPTGTDILGVGGWGRSFGSTTGYAYGGYFEGRSESTANGGAHGVEARAKNLTGLTVPTTQQAAASRFMGVWATASDGLGNVGVGVGSGDSTNGWDIGFQATSGGKYRTSAFVAEGLASGSTASAYMARANHFVGINFQDANFGGFAILLPDGKLSSNGMRFGGSETLYQDASTFQGDASSGLRIGTSGRVGFGKASVPRPTLPAAATDLASSITLVNAIRSALIANGLAN